MNKKQPSIRVKEIVLENFKNVSYGAIDLKHGKKDRVTEEASSILGIYGQNGSGKSSVIEALSILKNAMSALDVPSGYADCISNDANHSELTFVFEMNYSDGTNREATYSFSIKKAKDERMDAGYSTMNFGDFNELFDRVKPKVENKVAIYNERLSLKWDKSPKQQVIVDTSDEEHAFKPDTKRKLLVGTDKRVLAELEVTKRVCHETSKSFVFSPNLRHAIEEHCDDKLFFETLQDLCIYAKYYLFAIDSRIWGYIRSNMVLPIFGYGDEVQLVPLQNVNSYDGEEFVKTAKLVNAAGTVLSQILPGMSLALQPIDKSIGGDGKTVVDASIVTIRSNNIIPLKNESDGVKKLVSILNLLIMAFNMETVTVAIDELDEGLFEFLLGELLQALEEHGKGQLVFTSHNLRPLEVLNKNNLCFTTTNPKNRYVRFKNVSFSNNLRDMYFRELIMNEQEEELYSAGKKVKIAASFKEAGDI